MRGRGERRDAEIGRAECELRDSSTPGAGRGLGLELLLRSGVESKLRLGRLYTLQFRRPSAGWGAGFAVGLGAFILYSSGASSAAGLGVNCKV